MAMASAIVGQRTIIPLLMGFKPNEESSWAKLYHDVNVGTMANPLYERKKTQVLKFNKLDIELLCRNVHEFYDIADGVLALTTGGSQFEYYWQTLGGTAHDTWDAVVATRDIAAAVAWPQMVDVFGPVWMFLLPNTFMIQIWKTCGSCLIKARSCIR